MYQTLSRSRSNARCCQRVQAGQSMSEKTLIKHACAGCMAVHAKNYYILLIRGHQESVWTGASDSRYILSSHRRNLSALSPGWGDTERNSANTKAPNLSISKDEGDTNHIKSSQTNQKQYSSQDITGIYRDYRGL